MTDAVWIVMGILSVHWIGDFVLQSHWMATNKSKYLDALISHVAVYYMVLVVGTGFLLWHFYGADGWLWATITIWWMLNGTLHFLVDMVTSRLTARLWVNKDYHNFFVAIGFDQLMHYACLLITFHWMLGLPPR